MKNHIVINVLVFLGVFLFNLLFWREGMGVNALVFTLFLIIGLFVKDKEIFQGRSMQIITLGTIGFSIMIIINNSLYSKLLFIFSSILLIGLAQIRTIRFLGYGLFLGFWSIFETPFKMWSNLLGSAKKEFNFFKYLYAIRLWVIPVFITVFFLGIYSVANIEFATLIADMIVGFFDFFVQLEISWARVFFQYLHYL